MARLNVQLLALEEAAVPYGGHGISVWLGVDLLFVEFAESVGLRQPYDGVATQQ